MSGPSWPRFALQDALGGWAWSSGKLVDGIAAQSAQYFAGFE